VELEGRTAVVCLTEQGFQGIGSLLGLENSVQGKVCKIIGRDEFGLWISLEGEEWRRTVGIPWGFVAAIEMEWEGELSSEFSERRRRIGFEG
jgi:hypothetical protein